MKAKAFQVLLNEEADSALYEYVEQLHVILYIQR